MSKNNVSFQWVFKEFIWPKRKILFFGLFLIMVRSLSGLVLPYASKSLIDDVIPSKDTNSLTLLLLIRGLENISDRDRIRTYDRLLRRQMLYPAELRDHLYCL